MLLGTPRGRTTIFAPATNVGRSAISVVRISGPECRQALQLLTARPTPTDRVATLIGLRDPISHELLDRALVLYFEGPRSFTGEDMAELHLTGGRAVLAGVLGGLTKVPGLRLAEPGEFTLRAFENGKLDLSEVEGLADLVNAETAAQRRQALHIAGGALSREADAIRATILEAMAVLESQIDFSDVEDAEALSIVDARALANSALARTQDALQAAKSGERLRLGLNAVIAGPPNVGKSSLMNAIAKRDVSIVSASPGTTRDAIEVALDLKGYPVTLVDTAGIRNTDDPIEQEGVDRARRRAAAADLTLWLTDDWSSRDTFTPVTAGPVILIQTKGDLHADIISPNCEAVGPGSQVRAVAKVSARTGAGVSALLDEIARFAAEEIGNTSALIASERHRLAFQAAEMALARVIDPSLNQVEIVAEDLRLAARALERIAGRVDVEDVLGAIFSRLCVGK